MISSSVSGSILGSHLAVHWTGVAKTDLTFSQPTTVRSVWILSSNLILVVSRSFFAEIMCDFVFPYSELHTQPCSI